MSLALERERSLGHGQAEHERSNGESGETREHREPERAPRVAPEAPGVSRSGHEAAMREILGRSLHALNPPSWPLSSGTGGPSGLWTDREAARPAALGTILTAIIAGRAISTRVSLARICAILGPVPKCGRDADPARPVGRRRGASVQDPLTLGVKHHASCRDQALQAHPAREELGAMWKSCFVGCAHAKLRAVPAWNKGRGRRVGRFQRMSGRPRSLLHSWRGRWRFFRE